MSLTTSNCIPTLPTTVTSDGRPVSNNASLGRSLSASKEAGFRQGLYRPFNRQWVYFDEALNHRRGELFSMFPTSHHTNIGYYVVGVGSDKPFSTFATNSYPDLAFWGSSNGQFFPRWTYLKSESDGGLDFSDGDVDEFGYRCIDNITNQILSMYRSAVGEQVTKDDIFYYVYGILHDPDYRTRYAADLKKMLPHIPNPDSHNRFTTVADIGRELAGLHVNYESAAPYPLDVRPSPEATQRTRKTWRVDKIRWRSKTDRSVILYNGKVTITGIPAKAHDYLLGSRSALEWIIERYQVKTDHASGIVNDPNDWCDEHDDPTYIVDLIKKVTTVSVETVSLVEKLSQ